MLKGVGGVPAPMRDSTYQDLFHKTSELKGWQEKDGIEWESAKFEFYMCNTGLLLFWGHEPPALKASEQIHWICSNERIKMKQLISREKTILVSSKKLIKTVDVWQIAGWQEVSQTKDAGKTLNVFEQIS